MGARRASSTLARGSSCTIHTHYTVKVGDPDPLVNTVVVHYNPSGFPNDITSSATARINLFQPSVSILKTGPALSKATDTITYHITIKNTSSADAPNLILDSFSDSLVPGVTPPSACNTLAPAASCSFTYTYTVKTTDPDPLVNTATVHYHPSGFPNDITSHSTVSTNLFQPSVKVEKTCSPQVVNVGENITYTAGNRVTSTSAPCWTFSRTGPRSTAPPTAWLEMSRPPLAPRDAVISQRARVVRSATNTRQRRAIPTPW